MLRRIKFAGTFLAVAVFLRMPAAALGIDAHVAIVVMQPGAGGKIEKSSLSRQSAPGPGRRLQVWLESNDNCEALVAGFDSTGDLAYPDMPFLVVLKANELKAPAERDGWVWDSGARLRELDVVFLPTGSAESSQLNHLVDLLRNNKAAPPIRKRQIAELRKTIDALSARNAAGSDYTVKKEPDSLSGVYRGMDCDWCRSAQKIAVPSGGASVVRQRFP